ncbi:hypothetical protein Pint_28442 [Pistacia integerrima]|uniref:Uncharacterized protein n=1 Tax=Pistacia integerrima TaxID=434235 RepID=A0ACC0YSF2_9ROSI|nr:hypothetical protein Pint_28442 [Pistacia integerrima]
MNTNILHNLSSKLPSSCIPIPLKPSTTFCGRSIRIIPISCTTGSTNNTDGSDAAPQPVPPPPTKPPDTVEIRFRRRSRRQKQKREDGVRDKQPVKMQASASTTPPKNWDDMSLQEKAIELYVGEKGMLFWLNKFAYASIFIMIGAWILFRFVGPALNLYQLDSTPLSPSSIFKGS